MKRIEIITQSPDLIADEYIYRERFVFQRITANYLWYVTYENFIIARGQYRNDLEEWIDINYPKT